MPKPHLLRSFEIYGRHMLGPEGIIGDDRNKSSQPLAPRRLSGHQERAWISAGTTQFERSEILIPVAVGHVRILGFPLSQVEQILLGDLPFLCAITQMDPLLSRQPFPL